MISWKILIFAEAETTLADDGTTATSLWLAEKSLSLRKQRQPHVCMERQGGVVISWKILIFAEAETTWQPRHLRRDDVVISWKILIFAEAETTAHPAKVITALLWLAEKSLSLRKQRQPWRVAAVRHLPLWLAEKSLSLRKQRQLQDDAQYRVLGCD